MYVSVELDDDTEYSIVASGCTEISTSFHINISKTFVIKPVSFL